MNSGYINASSKRAYLKSHKVCAHCGGKANTIDHIIPCQIFEMTTDYEEDFRTYLRDRENWQPSCKSCNKKRGAHFDAAAIPITLYTKYKDNIMQYVKARNETLKEQNYKCAKCGNILDITDGVLKYKQKTEDYELIPKNCIVICYNCSEIKKKMERRINELNNSTQTEL